jgi:hypothetical protein
LNHGLVVKMLYEAVRIYFSLHNDAQNVADRFVVEAENKRCRICLNNGACNYERLRLISIQLRD